MTIILYSPKHPRDGKSRATLYRQGTRLGKRQRAEAREPEQMQRHDRVAVPLGLPGSQAGSSRDLPRRRPEPEMGCGQAVPEAGGQQLPLREAAAVGGHMQWDALSKMSLLLGGGPPKL